MKVWCVDFQNKANWKTTQVVIKIDFMSQTSMFNSTNKEDDDCKFIVVEQKMNKDSMKHVEQ